MKRPSLTPTAQPEKKCKLTSNKTKKIPPPDLSIEIRKPPEFKNALSAAQHLRNGKGLVAFLPLSQDTLQKLPKSASETASCLNMHHKNMFTKHFRSSLSSIKGKHLLYPNKYSKFWKTFKKVPGMASGMVNGYETPLHVLLWDDPIIRELAYLFIWSDANPGKQKNKSSCQPIQPRYQQRLKDAGLHLPPIALQPNQPRFSMDPLALCATQQWIGFKDSLTI
jgi:hypothetical protein